MKKKKRLRKWSPEALRSMDEEDFLDLFSIAVADRTNLEIGHVKMNNPIKGGAPAESVDLLLREAERRQIPIANIAQRIVARSMSGESFISNIVAPPGWRRYEIHAAHILLELLAREKKMPDFYQFDARIKGLITGEERQVDLVIGWQTPKWVTACEFKEYQTQAIAVGTVEAFVTKLRDIGASKGVMLSPFGFQKAAVQTAKHYGIPLLRLRELDAEQTAKERPDLSAELSSAQGKQWLLERDEDNAAWVFSGELL